MTCEPQQAMYKENHTWTLLNATVESPNKEMLQSNQRKSKITIEEQELGWQATFQ